MIDINFVDEWGGIDKKIKSSVLGLNKHGILTTGSCEGDNAPCPWIMVKSSSKRIKNKFDKLLHKFYKTRKVPGDIKIRTFPTGNRFYIYSGPEVKFMAWRKSVSKMVKGIAQGKEPGPAKTWKSLPKYQREFMRFGEFLLKDG